MEHVQSITLPPIGPSRDGPIPPDPVDALALAVRRREPDALGELYQVLAPVIRATLAHTMRRAAGLGLPKTLERDDLRQEVWLALVDLADRWDASRGAFGAYVNVSLGWMLTRAVERFSSTRSTVTMIRSVSHDVVTDWAARQPGDDGRSWADTLALRELLADLSLQERGTIGCLDLVGITLNGTAKRLGISRSTVQKTHKRALKRLRLGWRGQVIAQRSIAQPPPLARLLAALMAGRDPRSGVLPGRAECCRVAGLSQLAYGRLMPQLVERGVIVDRGERSPGRLNEMKALELLGALATAESN